MESDQTNHGQVGEGEYNGKKTYSARASENDRQGAAKCPVFFDVAYIVG